MAKIPEGVLGRLLGKVGPVTGYQRNGVNIIRTAARRKDHLMTPLRMAQREKIKIVNEFTRAFSGTGFFQKSFPAYGNSGSGYNRATSAIMNLAITGTYPAVTLSYPLILVSKGPLPPVTNAQSAKTFDGKIEFLWHDNSGTGTAKSNDKMILAAFYPELNQAVFSIGTATRKDEQALLNGPEGYEAETWIGLLSNDEMDAADSVYCGRVV